METKRKILFNLSEHDATQLLALINKEITYEDETWQPYWKRLAQTLEQAIEHASHSDRFRYLSYFNDAPEQ